MVIHITSESVGYKLKNGWRYNEDLEKLLLFSEEIEAIEGNAWDFTENVL